MKKQHYTAEIPVSNPYNFAAFEDLIANIQSGYNEEKRLKNAAFEFMINKGIYVDFHEWLHNPARPSPYSASPATDRVTTEKG